MTNRVSDIGWAGLVFCSLAMLAHVAPANAQSGSAARTDTPAWALAEMGRMVNDGDFWITDNSAYTGPEEPWEEYGMEWSWSQDSSSVEGRLFGLIGGEDRQTFWQMRMSWDGANQRFRLWQSHLTSGVVGDGEITRTGNGDETEAIQTFTAQDGTVSRVKHLSTTTREVHETRSYDWVDGEWQPRRQYTWRRRRAGASEISKAAARFGVRLLFVLERRNG